MNRTDRRASLRVGAFALAAAALLAVALTLVGAGWLGTREQARIFFPGSVWGLQRGAPVVFKGVRVGSVDDVTLAAAGPQGLLLPVTVRLETDTLLPLLGPSGPSGQGVVATLVDRGLVARLATQSLLTGLLYIELDIPETRRTDLSIARDARGLPVIPAEPTRIQRLQTQLEQVDVEALVQNLQDAIRGVRGVLADPGTAALPGQAVATLETVQRLALSLQAEAARTGSSARAALDASGARLATRTLPAIEAAADQTAIAASGAGRLAAGATPAVEAARRAADDLARTSAALREAVAGEAGLHTGADQALRDVSRAARSLADLAEQLDRHPDALLRGRSAAPTTGSAP